MQLDAVTIAVIAGVVAVLLLLLASTRRGHGDRPTEGGVTLGDAVASAASSGRRRGGRSR